MNICKVLHFFNMYLILELIKFINSIIITFFIFFFFYLWSFYLILYAIHKLLYFLYSSLFHYIKLLKLGLTWLNQLTILRREMSFNFYEVWITQGKNIAIRLSLNSKVSLHAAHVVIPLIDINIMFVSTCNYINDSEMITWSNGYILSHFHSW